eukprot:1452525-Rhodomonas_salina.3
MSFSHPAPPPMVPPRLKSIIFSIPPPPAAPDPAAAPPPAPPAPPAPAPPAPAPAAAASLFPLAICRGGPSADIPLAPAHVNAHRTPHMAVAFRGVEPFAAFLEDEDERVAVLDPASTRRVAEADPRALHHLLRAPSGPH